MIWFCRRKTPPSVPIQLAQSAPIPAPSSLDPDFYGVDLWTHAGGVRGNEEPAGSVEDFDIDSVGSDTSSVTSDSDLDSSSE